MYENIREEELKSRVAEDYFADFDYKKIIGNIDFCITSSNLSETESLLWAEAKKGKSDIYKSIVQLILTIGKARTFDSFLPPAFLGAFDGEKIAFIPYNDVQEIFYLNDFNWNVAPSNYETKEFKQVLEKVKTTIENNALLFFFENDEIELHEFIKINFVAGKANTSKIRIDKNNFLSIYSKWLTTVKPTIMVNWDEAKKAGIIDGDFYLADLLSKENETLKEKLYVLLKKDKYELDRVLNKLGMFTSQSTGFSDKQKAHNQFWNKYERPPQEQYWDYIVGRRDLLVPQDVRERKGSFYTPKNWVSLSQQYLADVLGEDWQDEYYIWDCAAGTGNLLAGLTNKWNIWASTLDKQDVDVMHDRIKNGANLLENHVFQFDFLNDDFSKLPKDLQNIINDREKREKLVIYINPPYAETATNKTSNKDRLNKVGVSFTKIQEKYSESIGIATKELFAQFLTRIYHEIPDATLAQFSKLKIVQGPNFFKFRNFFKAEFQKGFVVPASTFDNVSGNFPIGFLVWKLNHGEKFEKIICDVIDKHGNKTDTKTFYAHNENIFITDWYRKYHNRRVSNLNIGAIGLYGSDFQHNNFIRITNFDEHPNRWAFITKDNLIVTSIYLTVRHIFDANWLNDRDQFLYPNDGWETDKDFQNNCLAYALFHGQNRITSKNSVNHWIPFFEKEVNTKGKMESNFMANFIAGKLKEDNTPTMFAKEKASKKLPLEFSKEAKAVFEAGKALWTYYHTQENANPNASLYDIKSYFQGRSEKRMNNKSEDETYTKLLADLRKSLTILAKKIEPKVYEYGFLKA